jgi:hypothetical protein
MHSDETLLSNNKIVLHGYITYNVVQCLGANVRSGMKLSYFHVFSQLYLIKKQKVNIIEK